MASYTKRAVKNLGAAMRERREDLNLGTEEMGNRCNSSGASISSWELARNKFGPMEDRWQAIENGYEWPAGAVKAFLTGRYKTMDDIGGSGHEPETNGAEEAREALATAAGKGTTLKPDDPTAAARALKELLQSSMEAVDPTFSKFTIEVQIPVYWDRDRTDKVVKAAQKLAQQAINAYAAGMD